MDALTLPLQPAAAGAGIAPYSTDPAGGENAGPLAFSALLAAELLGTSTDSAGTGSLALPGEAEKDETTDTALGAEALVQPEGLKADALQTLPVLPVALPVAPAPARADTAAPTTDAGKDSTPAALASDAPYAAASTAETDVAALPANSAGGTERTADDRDLGVEAAALAPWETGTVSTPVEQTETAPVHAQSGMLHLQAPDARPAAATTVASLTVSAPVGSPDFAESLSQQVVWMTGKDAEVAELRLNPPELGPVQVRITVSGDEASAVFVSPVSEVRAAISDSLDRLRESLAGAGISLGEASVSAESFQDRSSQGQEGGTRGGRSNGGADTAWAPAAVREPVRRGLVDLYA